MKASFRIETQEGANRFMESWSHEATEARKKQKERDKTAKEWNWEPMAEVKAIVKRERTYSLPILVSYDGYEEGNFNAVDAENRVLVGGLYPSVDISCYQFCQEARETGTGQLIVVKEGCENDGE